MKYSIDIAKRYLFGKKSTNAINIITSISVIGVAIGTAALILVLSVFNGFEDLISSMVNSFNPDIKVVPAKGKTFNPNEVDLAQIKQLSGVDLYTLTLEEIAMMDYDDNQDFATIKGVDQNFEAVCGVDSMMREGSFKLQHKAQEFAVIGAGVANRLSINIDDQFTALEVYMPKRNASAFDKLFYVKLVYPSGVFAIQQDFDYQYVLTSLDFVQELLNVENEVSAIEIKLKAEADIESTREAIQQITGDAFVVKDRYMQDEAFIKLMNLERWMSYAVIVLTFLVVAFNIIGTLWMIVLDKRKDIAILKAMGTRDRSIVRIFLNEGILICGLGMLIGFFIAIVIYVIHKQVGIVPIPEGFIIDAYPVELKALDFVIVALTVMIIGILASLAPSVNAAKIPASFNEE